MLDLKHGGHVLPKDAPGASDAARRMGDRLVKSAPAQSPFDYLLPQLKSNPASRLPGDPVKVAADLRALGSAMVDGAPGAQTDAAVEVNSNIPAVYTYWGQFIDHDMTANTDRDSTTSDITRTPLTPVDPADVAKKLKNLRRPTFDLDHVYGNGPGLDENEHHPDPGPADKGFYDGIRLRVGANADGPGIPGVKIPPAADLSRDLPRIGPLLSAGAITDKDIPESLKTDPNLKTRAFIGDLRNDENLVVAQFHLAFLRFHNNVVDALEADPEAFGLDGHGGGAGKQARRFAAARRLVRFHYQWLVVHDYLKTVCLPGVVDKVLVGGNKVYKPLPGGQLFAPLEYSVAAFRFGHSMVRGAYDHNRNFGTPVAPAAPVLPVAPFAELFRFTGNGHGIDSADITKSTSDPFRGQPTLPFNWIIEWDRFSNKADPKETHFARKIDTRLAPPILNMVNEGTGIGIQDDANKPLRQLLRSLAQRNLLRGYLLSIPTGQAVAQEMGVAPMSADELRQGNSDAVDAALEGGGFLEHTPLWYYVLKEAEVRANGNSLGELGSRIVVETQIGLLRNDPNSFLNAKHGWDPSEGVKLSNGDPIVTIRDFFAFADLAA
ncbi:MAG TPA: heme peroxidase family protein [Solirubrobacteraceae bacterium]|nr:heme peroxidase family protein [Solirubrobacteraceae bacterium]